MVAPSILFEWKQLFLINCSVMKAFKCSFLIYLAFSMSIRCSERTTQPEKKNFSVDFRAENKRNVVNGRFL